jgi:hypothetical protein
MNIPEIPNFFILKFLPVDERNAYRIRIYEERIIGGVN